jgi:hypothetical protein
MWCMVHSRMHHARGLLSWASAADTQGEGPGAGREREGPRDKKGKGGGRGPWTVDRRKQAICNA